LKQRIISITETDRKSRRGRASILEVHQPDQAPPIQVHRLGKLTRGLQPLIIAGSGWIEFKGKQTLLRCLVDAELQTHLIERITATTLAFVKSKEAPDRGAGTYYIGTVRGIYTVVTHKGAKATFVPAGTGDGHPHVRDIRFDGTQVCWTDVAGNTGRIDPS
jgi:hypothetical protein